MADKKKTETPEETAALQGQVDQMLTLLAEQSEEIERLKRAQTGISAQAVHRNTVQEDMDAELQALQEEFKDYPSIEVFSRRAIEGVDANLDIRLKDEVPLEDDPKGTKRRWKLRWFNFGIENRAQRATAEGYVKVRWDELRDQESVASMERKDEFVRKGDRGLEVLCKIPLKLWDYKRRRDRLRQDGILSSESKLRDMVANSVSAKAGAFGDNADQAGSFVSNTQGFQVSITPGQPERFTA